MHFTVDTRERTPLSRIWRYVGYDEPNYTYTDNGQALLRKLGQMGDAPYQIRCHFLLCSGDAVGQPKWGSTNVYTEDAERRAIYTWHVIDRILDTIIEAGCIPFVELGFMPEALSSAPQGLPYAGPTAEGWGYPPRDYSRWLDLIRALARHCLERYGLREVSRWTWELWNEPDIFYWRGTVDEYCRLYDYTVAGLVSVLPQAKVGGPGTTSPANRRAGDFLRSFLLHCTAGENAVSGRKGTRLDYISFHTKGGGYGREPNAPKKTPTLRELMRHVDAGLAIIAEFPSLCRHEVILSECDPDGWAAGSIQENPNLAYRNSEYYASYVASAACKLLQTQHGSGPRVDGMLTWAFQFEDRDFFAGLRTLSTNGIDKPVLNVFRLLAMMGGSRLNVVTGDESGTSADSPEVSAMASLDGTGAIAILLSSHHDDWDVDQRVHVALELSGIDDRTTYDVTRTVIDRDHANSYTAWLEMGCPQPPQALQRRALVEASHLRPLSSGSLSPEGGRAVVSIELQAHSVCLLQLRPAH